MKRTALNPLLACAALLASGAAAAVPRGEVVEPDPDTPAEAMARRLQTAADMATWLPRLVGRFRIQGTIGAGSPRPIPITGAADCIAVGRGSGVHCVLNAVWGAKGDSLLGPASILFGMDPAAGMVRYLQLNTDGVVTSLAGTGEGPALLKNDTLSWWCETNHKPHPCMDRTGREMTMRMRAPSDGKFIQMTLYSGGRIGINLDMDRVPGNEQDKASKPDPARRRRQ